MLKGKSDFNVFVPLEIGRIDEGLYMDSLNSALSEAQSLIVKHVKKYGVKAKGSKTEVTAKVTLICMDPEAGAYGCIASVKTSIPSAPATTSVLMAGETQTDEDCLLTRKSGSSKDHPAQKILCTQDGRPVNTQTGEIVEPDKKS